MEEYEKDTADIDYFEDSEEITPDDLEELILDVDETKIAVAEEELDEDGVDFTLASIPRLVHVDEQNVTVCVSDLDVIPATIFGKPLTLDRLPIYVCEFCQKSYKSERWYKLHIEGCLNKAVKTVSVAQTKDEEDLMEKAVEFLQIAVASATDCVYYDIAEPGLSVKKLAFSLCQHFESHYFIDYANNLQKNMLSILKKETIVKNTQTSLSKFYGLVVNKDEVQKWDELLQNLGCSSCHSLFLLNFVADSFLTQILSHYGSQAELESLNIEKLSITKDEEQTLYYIAGYLVFSLKQNMRTSTSKPNPLVALLDSWGSKDSSKYQDLGIDEYVRTWVEQVDRGGLFKVNSQFYQAVVKIEKLARTILNLNLFATYSGENLKEVLRNKIMACTVLLNSWKSLTINLEEGVRSKLFHKLITKWINVRANAFVKVWLQQYKWKKAKEGEKVTEQGEPSLRKGLSKKGGKKIVDRSLISPKKKLKGTPQKSCVIAASSKLKKAKRVLNKSKKKLNL